MQRVAIVGCGAIGAMLSYELNKTDVQVSVFESRSQPATGSTGAALGVLMAACSSKAKGDLVTLRLQSLRRYDRLIDELRGTLPNPLEILYNRQGILNLYQSADAEVKARSLIEIRQEQGFELQWLDRDTVSQQFPQWQTQGGLFSPCDRAVHPSQLVNALVAAAQNSGVQFYWNAPIHSVTDLLADHDRVVVTAGIGSNPLLAPLLKERDQDLLQPVGGQALLLRVPDLNLAHVVHFENADGSDTNVVPLGDDRYWLGATVEFEYEQLPRQANVELLLNQAIAWCPIFGNAEVIETWAGDRPRPLGVRAPILGFVPNHPQILIATGHYRNGVMMAPITAQITKDLLLTGTSDLPWQRFSL